MELAAIFDWDGVIIDSSAQHERAWELLSAETGLALPEGHFKRGFGKKNEVIIPDLGWATERNEVARLALRKEELYREQLRRAGIRPLPGVRELLAALAAEKIPCAVGSSTPRANIEAIFDILGLRDFFQAVVSGEDVMHGKPAPDVFLLAAEKLGAAPARCVVFEDALVGIEAAHAAGMVCVAVATTNPLDRLGHAELAVETLSEVSVSMLRALRGRTRVGHAKHPTS